MKLSVSVLVFALFYAFGATSHAEPSAEDKALSAELFKEGRELLEQGQLQAGPPFETCVERVPGGARRWRHELGASTHQAAGRSLDSTLRGWLRPASRLGVA